MRLEQLRYFTAVVEAGSIRRASEELHVSQPAISEALANLEREFKVALLERTRTGARITAAGRQLLPYLTAVLDDVERLSQAADHQRTFRPVVRIGTVNAATAGLLSPAIAALNERHPGTEIEVVNAVGDKIDDRLREGRLDIGLINRLADEEPTSTEFESRPLLQGRPVVCFRADSEIAALDRIPTEALAGTPIVAMRRGFVMHRLLERLFTGLGQVPPVSCYVDGADMGKLLVARGAGVTVLPDYSVADDPLVEAGVLAYRPIDDATTRIVLEARTLRTRFAPVLVREMVATLSEIASRQRARTPPAFSA